MWPPWVSVPCTTPSRPPASHALRDTQPAALHPSAVGLYSFVHGSLFGMPLSWPSHPPARSGIIDFLVGYFILLPAISTVNFRLCDCNNTASGCTITDPNLLCYLATFMFYFTIFLSYTMVTSIMWTLISLLWSFCQVPCPLNPHCSAPNIPFASPSSFWPPFLMQFECGSAVTANGCDDLWMLIAVAHFSMLQPPVTDVVAA